ncbi:DUF4118 domain-containing protein [Plantibacter sp. Mn2098]|uniref:DUF4118 domain-containing protein n=1 Tax=Plantibacter sp. Mn2098 TaxID=3395266 RepID=UPI003BD69B19
MTRGRLRVFLGAAPGVGKTFAMLEEGARLRDAGIDVVVGLVETHGRAATAALTNGLEIVPRATVEHSGVTLSELDLDAIIARKPELALVDELAHTNAPGSTAAKRWQDVDTLLDAGIDVLSTVNIQHIESLTDVVERITGVRQRETIPDHVLRAADQVELVDLVPQALRARLSAGEVYPADRIDAALSHYFRLGNLTALRELALLWLADDVDSALGAYRAAHEINDRWDARERVVVALTGGPEGDTLIRRGARIASRSAGGDLVAVHVATQDGLRDADPGVLANQRALVERLGGSYHQVLGQDIPEALVTFAKASNATQLVVGVSRRSRVSALLGGPGIGATVIRESGDIDVHMVAHAAAGSRAALPRFRGALTVRRRVLGFVLALVGGPILTWLLELVRAPETLTPTALTYQLFVVIVALLGGLWPAVFAAVLSGVTLDFFFIAPVGSITISDPSHLVALVLYVAIAALVSVVVDQAARRSRSAARAGAESDLLATVAGSVIRGENALQALVSRTREAFGLVGVRLLRGREAVVTDGEPADEAHTTRLPVGADATLELSGRHLEAADRRALGAIIAQMEAVIEREQLRLAAEEMLPLEQTDRVRSALLAAVGHDLRRPLAAATAAVTALNAPNMDWNDGDREQLLETAEASLASLSGLVTNLLDASRLQAGVLAVALAPTAYDDVLLLALDELGLGPGAVHLELPPDAPNVLADAVLLQRVVVNVIGNALRFSPADEPPVVRVSTFQGAVELRVVDRGPGVPAERKDDIFVPFQRLGDDDNTTGLGLGLALSRGFMEGMGGSLDAEDTPGGGLTMVLRLEERRGPDADEPQNDDATAEGNNH